MSGKIEKYWSGYNTQPVGGDNPYYCCVGCGRTDPEINGSLNRHGPACSEVQRYLDEENPWKLDSLFVEGEIEHDGDLYEYCITTMDNQALVEVIQTSPVVGVIYPLGDKNCEFDSVEAASETLRDAVTLMVAKKILDDAGVSKSHVMWKLGKKG